MKKSLSGEKIAVLVANGFNEPDYTGIQQLFQPLGAKVCVVSMEKGLVHGWRDDAWGLSFATERNLSESLAADFSLIVVPGGQKSIDKLKLTEHTGRFLKGFMDMGKPVLLLAEAVDLLLHCDRAAGRQITGPKSLSAAALEAGAVWVEESYVLDGHLMTCTGGENLAGKIGKAFIQMVDNEDRMDKAA